MLRKSSIPLAVAAAALLAGCPHDVPTLTVAITAPKNGATLTMANDSDNTKGGLQTDVKATTSGFGTDAKATLTLDGTAVGTAISLAADGSASFTGVTLTSGTHVIDVSVTDSNGTADNKVTVVADDTVVACAISIAAPKDGALLNIKSDVSDEAGLQYFVEVKSTGCAGGAGNVIRVCGKGAGFTGTKCKTADGYALGELAVAANNDTKIKVTLPDGTGEIISAEYDNGTTPATVAAAVTVSVDTKAPTCAFVYPQDKAALSAQQITVQLQCTDAEVDQDITVTSSGAASPVGTGKMTADGNVSFAATLPLGSQTLTATIADKAGNTGTATISVSVAISGCDVVLDEPFTPSISTAIFNIANAAPTGTPLVGKFTFKDHTTRCAGGTATFTKTLGGNATVLGTTAVDSNGKFSMPVTFADGETDDAKITIKIDLAGMASNNGVDVSYMADFTAPKLDDAIPTLGKLNVVNPSNPNVGKDPTYLADADPKTAGGQVAVNLTVEGVGNIAKTGWAANRMGSLAIQDDTKPTAKDLIVPVPVSDNGKQTLPPAAELPMTIPEGFSGTITITLTDSAGNTTKGTWDAKVSTVALPVPVIASPSAGNINVFNDFGGDRATFAQTQGQVNFTGLPSGSFIELCSTVAQPGSTAPCDDGQPGYLIPGTKVAASGTSQFYSSFNIAEGVQEIRAVLMDAVGDTISSTPVHLVVDTIPPKVLTFVCTDDKNSDKIVAGSELAAGLAATFTATFSGVEDGQLATLSVDGIAQPNPPTVTGNAATFSVPNVVDGKHDFKVSVTDKAGNPNESTAVTPPITDPAATVSYTFARLAPTILVEAPSFTICNQKNAKSYTATNCDFDFTVSVGSSADHVNFSMSPSVGSFTPATITPTAGVATTTVSLPQSTSSITLTATVFDAAGNSSKADYIITLVDTVAPLLTIVSPPPPGPDVMSAQTFPVTVTTDAEAGQVVTAITSVGGTVVGTGSVVAGGATFNVSVPATTPQTLSLTVTDLAGNTSVVATVIIQLNLTGCPVTFLNPSSANPTFNATNAPGGLVHITGSTSTSAGCTSQKIDFSVSAGGGPVTQVGSASPDGSGNFSFDYTFTDGSVTIFSAVSEFAGSTSNFFTATTDITPPTLSVTAPMPDGSSNLYVTAKVGNLNVKKGVAGYLPDLDDTIAGGQVAFNLTATGAGPSAGSGTGSVEILQGGVSKFKQTIADNGAQPLSPQVTLDQAFKGDVVVVATDAAGNTATTTLHTTVDVVAPDVPTVTRHVTVDERHCDIDMDVTVPADSAPAGSTLTWDFGYSTSTLLGTNPFDDAAFDDATITVKVLVAAPGATGSTSTLNLRWLPPLNTIDLAPRAVDSIGNRSAQAFTPHDVNPHTPPAALQWGLSTTSYSGTFTETGFGSRVSVADIDKAAGGSAEVGVSFPAENGNTGSVTIYEGGAIPLVQSQKLVGAGANAYFGSPFVLADVNCDGFADLVVSNNGSVEVYFGSSTGLVTPAAFKFSGESAKIMVPVLDMGSLVAGLPSSTKDGCKEIAIGAPSSGSSAGKLFIFMGRADWSGVISGGVVAYSSADIIIDGVTANTKLTGQNGVLSIPDIDGDLVADLVVGSSPSTVGGVGANKVFVFSGATLISKGKTATVNDALQTITVASPARFGSALAVIDSTGSGQTDLVIADSGSAVLYLATHQPSAPFFPATANTFFTSTTALGWSLATGDLNGDGVPDLFAGGNDTNPAPFLAFWSTPTGLNLTNRSAVLGAGGHGTSIAIGEVSGDTAKRLDLVTGEYLNGIGDFKIYY